jgi:hypothetical protein
MSRWEKYLSAQENAKVEGPRPRTVVSVIKLWALIDEQVQRTRSPHCGTCRSPVPFFQDRSGDHAANWSIAEPPHCELGCHLVIQEVIEDLAAEYDVSHAVWAPSLIV